MKKVCIRLILVALSLVMVSASATLQEAQRLYEQGRNAQALAKVEELLVEKPNDAELRFLKGIIYAESGDSDKAIETFAALTQDYPELPEPWNNLAVLFAEQGEFDKSREALLAAIQTHPSYSTAHENLGDLYARMAGMAYDRALEQDRGNESARLKLSAVNGLFAAPRETEPQTSIVAAATPEPRPVAAEPVTRPAPAVSTTPEPEPEPVQAAVQPPVTAPAEPEPVAAPPAARNAGAVIAAVNRWAQAWSSQNVDGYIASYVPNYRPSNGASHQAWAAYRRDRLTAPSVIEVDLSNVQVSFNSDTSARVVFNQKYRSDNYRDEVTKELVLTQSGGEWRIASEVSQ